MLNKLMQKGFTLIELIVVEVIILVMAVGMIYVFSNSPYNEPYASSNFECAIP
jgi:prepilin-type N-terminal cleavage/methylation domain-containing protein